MQISIRELKANPARAIALTRQGQRVQITSHRKVVAELVAPCAQRSLPSSTADEQALARLLASGLVAEAPTQPLQLGEPIDLPSGSTLFSDWVVQERGPRAPSWNTWTRK